MKKENDVALLTRSPRRNKELRTAFSHAPLKSNKLKFFRREGVAVEAASILRSLRRIGCCRFQCYQLYLLIGTLICRFMKVAF